MLQINHVIYLSPDRFHKISNENAPNRKTNVFHGYGYLQSAFQDINYTRANTYEDYTRKRKRQIFSLENKANKNEKTIHIIDEDTVWAYPESTYLLTAAELAEGGIMDQDIQILAREIQIETRELKYLIRKTEFYKTLQRHISQKVEVRNIMEFEILVYTIATLHQKGKLQQTIQKMREQEIQPGRDLMILNRIWIPTMNEEERKIQQNLAYDILQNLEEDDPSEWINQYRPHKNKLLRFIPHYSKIKIPNVKILGNNVTSNGEKVGEIVLQTKNILVVKVLQVFRKKNAIIPSENGHIHLTL